MGLCGLAGYYRQFSRTDWVEKILTWQKHAGCYGRADDFFAELMSIGK